MERLPGLDAAYRHYAKEASFRGLETNGGAWLKWYDLARTGEPVAAEIHIDAREFIRARLASEGFAQPGDCGFVILHRCGVDFYFLLVSIWRGNNEVWEAVFYRDRGMPGFEAFQPAYGSPGALRPTFCVWELDVVVFEAKVWADFSTGSRTGASLAMWQQAVYAG